MNEGHFHLNAMHFLAAGISAVLFINILRFASAKLAQSSNPGLAALGGGLGATVHWGN